MDVEITVPQTPVTLAPGAETRVPVEMYNRSSAAMSLRLGVARSRAGAWARAEPPIIELAAGDRASCEIVFAPPVNTPSTPSLLPFTVQAEDARYGDPAGRATGLLTIAAPDRLDASLTRDPSRRGPARFTLTLDNHGVVPLTLRLAPDLQPAGGRVDVAPTVVDVPTGASATAQVMVRPRLPLVGASTPYRVSISCHDVASGDAAAALATVEGAGAAEPRLGRMSVGLLVTAVVVLAAATAVMATGLVEWPGSDREPSATPPSSAPAVHVRRPYALVDVFPQQDGQQGRAKADETLGRLAAAGVPVRLVDSTASPDVAEGQTGGLWVLLQDGFPSADAAQAYCDQHRANAPKCEVVR